MKVRQKRRSLALKLQEIPPKVVMMIVTSVVGQSRTCRNEKKHELDFAFSCSLSAVRITRECMLTAHKRVEEGHWL